MTIDIQRFCGSQFSARLQQPWSIGAYTYASNGHIAIRVPRRDDVPENTEAPASIERVFAHDGVLEFRGLPEIDIPVVPLAKCRACFGVGRGAKCDECDGEGELECDLGHMHACDCGGSGIEWRHRSDIPDSETYFCAQCDGRGRDEDRRIISFVDAGLLLRVPYLQEVMRLPGPLFIAVQPMTECRYTGRMEHTEPVLFRFEGGMAAIMPMRGGVSDIEVRFSPDTTEAR